MIPLKNDVTVGTFFVVHTHQRCGVPLHKLSLPLEGKVFSLENG